MLEQWSAFLQDRWVVIAVAAVVVLVLIKMIKTAMKWALILVVAAGLLFYGANYKEAVQDISGTVLSYAKEEAFEAMKKEAEQAKYSQDGKGGFTVTSPNFTVRGSIDGEEVEVTFRGQTFKVDRNAIIEEFINQARTAS